uniref:Odorant receptor n=1 Tax=Locusta migratoria TaxID=7004 RepID=A0A0M3SBM7_LOCMI|nr:odorant receptor 129 [Locusta migratoria]
MSMPDSELRTLLGSGASIRQLMGLWWPRGRRGRGRACSAAAAAVSLASLAWLPTFSGLKLLIDPPPEIEEIAMCYLLIFACTGFFSKAAFLIYKGETVWKLLDLLSETRRLHRNGESNDNIRLSYQQQSRRVYLYMQGAICVAFVFWVSTPLLVRAFLASDEDSPESYRLFPVPLWFPGNMYLSPTYEILYSVQSFSVLVAAQSTVCVDIFFFHLMLMISAEVQVLNENIALMEKVNLKSEKQEDHELRLNIKEKAEDLSFRSVGYSTGKALTEEVSDENMCVQLVKNIQHHQLILRSVVLLQDIMNLSVFILLFVNMVDLCSCIFVGAVLLQRDGNVTKALKPLSTVPPLLYETGMYCIFGQILSDQSEKLTDSAISCGWVDCNDRFKRDFMFLLISAKKPLEITVGKTSKLSKQMLVQVLNGSYGLLNLLYHFQSIQ